MSQDHTKILSFFTQSQLDSLPLMDRKHWLKHFTRLGSGSKRRKNNSEKLVFLPKRLTPPPFCGVHRHLVPPVFWRRSSPFSFLSTSYPYTDAGMSSAFHCSHCIVLDCLCSFNSKASSTCTDNSVHPILCLYLFLYVVQSARYWEPIAPRTGP